MFAHAAALFTTFDALHHPPPFPGNIPVPIDRFAVAVELPRANSPGRPKTPTRRAETAPQEIAK